MKPFGDYSGTVTFVNEYEFKGNLSRTKPHAQRLAEINDTPMTVEQRKDALAVLSKEADEAWKAQLDTYRKDQKRVWQEFLQDCRDELKYSEFLTEEGCRWLEDNISTYSDNDYEKRTVAEIYYDRLREKIYEVKEILSYVKVK